MTVGQTLTEIRNRIADETMGGDLVDLLNATPFALSDSYLTMIFACQDWDLRTLIHLADHDPSRLLSDLIIILAALKHARAHLTDGGDVL